MTFSDKVDSIILAKEMLYRASALMDKFTLEICNAYKVTGIEITEDDRFNIEDVLAKFINNEYKKHKISISLSFQENEVPRIKVKVDEHLYGKLYYTLRIFDTHCDKGNYDIKIFWYSTEDIKEQYCMNLSSDIIKMINLMLKCKENKE
ncbi:hypothetical protein I0O79_001341 [Campylobacter jejuni]|nr:hypothetical protein [Campylobacter jejuni]